MAAPNLVSLGEPCAALLSLSLTAILLCPSGCGLLTRSPPTSGAPFTPVRRSKFGSADDMSRDPLAGQRMREQPLAARAKQN
jgi:hypothetical protein